MNFLLRIYFAGMIAFIPAQNGTDVHILLLEAGHGHLAADGTRVEPHRPLLLARAGRCEGEGAEDCRGDAAAIAGFLYRDLGQSYGSPLERLARVIEGGGAWDLDDSELELVLGPSARDVPPAFESFRAPLDVPAPAPRSAAEATDLCWLADVSRILGEPVETRSDLLAPRLPAGTLAGRLRLSRGTFQTHRLVPYGAEVRPIDFRVLDADGASSASASPSRTFPSQALAHWLMVEIPLDDCRVEIVERGLEDGEERRRMKLSPEDCRDGGVVELALLNVPPAPFRPIAGQPDIHHYIGRHFEMYYDLLENPPARRPVPFIAAGPGTSVDLLHPAGESDFVEALVPGPGRGLVSPPICPPALFPAPSK